MTAYKPGDAAYTGEPPRPVPSVGHIVHFVYGDHHVPAIITDPAFRVVTDSYDAVEQALTVFPPNAEPFTTCAKQDEGRVPGTWHWPEFASARGAWL